VGAFVKTKTAVGRVQLVAVRIGFGEMVVRFALAAIPRAITLVVFGAFFFMLVGGVFAGHR
jgi:hypothetical protein